MPAASCPVGPHRTDGIERDNNGIVPSARVGDILLYFEVRGVGTPPILIPGIGTDVRMFQRVMRDLAAHFRVLAFDPRGAGR
jgi:pimeloyl-ACP methyl ester carboxylesterase